MMRKRDKARSGKGENMTRPFANARESHGSRKEATRQADTQTQQQSESITQKLGGIRGIMSLQSTIGNRAVAQLVRNQARSQPQQVVRQHAGDMHVQLMPTFRSEKEAIYYFEDWEEDTVFTEHAREVKQLLLLAQKNGWEDLKERIEYAQSESELVAMEQFKTWDLSNDALLPAAMRLLDKAQNKGWEKLEDLVIAYVRKSEDSRDEPSIASDGLLQNQRDFLIRWATNTPIPKELLKKLVLHAGETDEGLAWLTALLQLPIPTLTIPQFDLITSYKADLSSNEKALRWVVRTVHDSESIEKAKAFIELAKEFNYDMAFALEAVAGSEAHADGVRESEFQKIRENKERQKQKVMKIGYEKALESLTRAERKEVEKNLITAETKSKIEQNQNKFTESINDSIDERAQEAEQEVIKVIGPEAYAKRRDEYLFFFQLVNYDPATLPALELCGHNFKVAEQIVHDVQQAPNLLAFIGQEEINMKLYERCISEVQLPTLNMLLTQINGTELLSYAESGPCLQLLTMLHLNNVPVPHMKQLANRPERLQYCDPQFTADYSQLLVHYTPHQFCQLIDLVPEGAQSTVRFLLTLQPFAASSADLLTCLNLAKRMYWDQTHLTTHICSMALGRTGPQLTAQIYAQRLMVFDRDTKFHSWVNTVGILMTDEGYTVTVGESFQLSGINTYERKCKILDAGGVSRGKFVVHYHPGAKQSVQHPYGSGAHIKPNRGDLQTPRIGREFLPESLRGVIPLKK